MNDLVLNASQYGVSQSRAKQIEEIFIPMIDMIKEFEKGYDKIIEDKEQKGITVELTQAAKAVRLKIAKVRIETEKIRKREKEEYLRGGKAIDGVANILKFAVTEKEKKLKDIETHFERIEQERLAGIQAQREQELLAFGVEVNIDIASMPDEVWLKYKDGYKLAYEEKKKEEERIEAARIKAEKEAEEEHKRIAEENERLKREAAEREQREKKEREKTEKERQKLEEKLRKEREQQAKKEAAEKEQKRKEEEERDRVLQKEREEKERLAKELAEKKAEEKRIAYEKAAKNKALRLAPDKEKLLLFAENIQALEIPLVTNSEAQTILQQAQQRLATTYSDLIKQAQKL